jgi:AcrR family transcriptional regulator
VVVEHVLAEDHRKAIIAAAIKLMSREGVAAASTRRVAAEAGVPQSTIHYVFGTKTQLYRAVIETVAARLVRALGAVSSNDAWAEQVTGTFDAIFEVIADDPLAALLVVELTTWALRDPDLRDLASDLHRAYHRVAEEAVTDLRQNAGDRTFRLPSDEMAAISVAAINGIIMTFLVHGDRERSRRELRRLATAMTRFDLEATVPAT